MFNFVNYHQTSLLNELINGGDIQFIKSVWYRIVVTKSENNSSQDCGVGVGVGVGVGQFSSTPTPARSRSRLQHFFIFPS